MQLITEEYDWIFILFLAKHYSFINNVKIILSRRRALNRALFIKNSFTSRFIELSYK